MKLLAIIRIKGVTKTRKEIIDTLYLLRLRRTNTLVLYPDREDILGMLKKVEPYVAYGEIKKETLEKLLLKRGRIVGNKRLTKEYIEKVYGDWNKFLDDLYNCKISLKDVKDVKPFFRLKPPSNGYPRKGIKLPYKLGGAYGYWGEDINNLIESMI